MMHGPKSTARTDILTLLQEEHDEMEVLIKTVLDSADADDVTDLRRRVLAEIRAALVPQAKAEEDVLYARLAQDEQTRPRTLEGTQEHLVFLRLLGELHAMTLQGEVWMAKFKVFAENVEHHLREEEQALFPQARTVLTTLEGRELVGAYQAAREGHARDAAAA
ncbi:MAG: hemerythrin domain-containing protein [Pseudomonadota bacterium]|nr:hemerythrin domain-containing protein [Pseudomonadota bacterium]